MKILNTFYETLCDYSFDGPKRSTWHLKNKIIYVPHDNIAEFFYYCKEPCIVISANSDYGIQYQDEHPISKDLFKWLNFIKEDEKQGYSDLLIPARCTKELCKITDRYSVKMYVFTKATFPEIPSNIIKWYSTNIDIEDDRVVGIPFGVPEWTYNVSPIKPVKKQEKIYINFQINTIERQTIRNMCHGNDFFLSEEVSKQEYINDLAQCKYVLCPPGNGLDTFRVCETIYAGSIPVVFESRNNRRTYGDSVLYVDNFNQINLNYLNSLEYNTSAYNNQIFDPEYWRRRINEDRYCLQGST